VLSSLTLKVIFFIFGHSGACFFLSFSSPSLSLELDSLSELAKIEPESHEQLDECDPSDYI
jgi:hypothetical protein